MSDRSEMGEFLRSRRSRLRPEDIGLPVWGRRRVPGLRREEVAHLAGVSVEYYVRLEQGRAEAVSEGIIDAIATALRLSADEQRHLHNLAKPPRSLPRPDEPLRPGLQQLLDSMTRTPAYIVGHRTDILGWNAAAVALFGIDFAELAERERTWLNLIFFDPGIRALTADSWPMIAGHTAADMRLRASHRPDDPELRELLCEMTERSPEFREFWETHEVSDFQHGRYVLRHPLVGELHVDYELLDVPADPGVRAIVTYSAAPGSASERALAAALDVRTSEARR
ncbi:helix-turn-helix transcriptional regulator [Nocardia sp. CDC153]|uniref:helix-turn-helix domain-containing protein n=1 Tax=Nocardia sp. CDC153 TaxID=3112167 RepID=UPI002DBFD472|nr:helix-turn-helix transcriptional regulator [Nocardia sp. CDC153]MEC3955444.1 helix-turn-helix transcriptional regulator [Nocardia sp. CDC153]